MSHPEPAFSSWIIRSLLVVRYQSIRSLAAFLIAYLVFVGLGLFVMYRLRVGPRDILRALHRVEPRQRRA